MNSGARVETVALIVAGALFMQMLDATIIVTAIPAMAHSFGVAPLSMGVGITAYVLTVAILIPATGWLATIRVGARGVFLGAIVVFTLGSLLCGIAGDLPQFIAAPYSPGGPAARFIVPVGQIIVLRLAERSQLVRTLSLLSWPALFAPSSAPPLAASSRLTFPGGGPSSSTFRSASPAPRALAAWLIPDSGYRQQGAARLARPAAVLSGAGRAAGRARWPRPPQRRFCLHGRTDRGGHAMFLCARDAAHAARDPSAARFLDHAGQERSRCRSLLAGSYYAHRTQHDAVSARRYCSRSASA